MGRLGRVGDEGCGNEACLTLGSMNSEQMQERTAQREKERKGKKEGGWKVESESKDKKDGRKKDKGGRT